MNRRGKISLLVLFLSVCCTAALLTYQSRQTRFAVPHRDLYDLVCRQLLAFRADDFTRAYEHASTGVQQQFSLVEFRQMIRTNYAGITRYYSVELGPVKVRGDSAIVHVYFVSETGAVQPCIYSLVRERNIWKIDGARLLPRWPAGATLSGTRV